MAVVELFDQAWAFHQVGDLAAAELLYERVLQEDPRHFAANKNLGDILAQTNRNDAAIGRYREALLVNPDFAPAWNNLGCLLAREGKLDEAVAAMRQALALRPDYPEGHNTLGFALFEQKNFTDAVASFQRALQIWPDFADAHDNLGQALADQGRLAEAETHLQESLRLKPTSRKRVLLATVLPPIYASQDDLLAWRQRFTINVRSLSGTNFCMDLGGEKAVQNFFLVYQGFDDKNLQRLLAKLYSAPTLPATATRFDHRPGEKLRIGFISQFFKEHTIARLMRGLIANLSREHFHVTVLACGREKDSTTQWIRDRADEFVELPLSVPVAAQLIAEQNLDVLFYTDIGMEPITYSLAFFRLAPVQCVTWGHPVTTGIPTIDYFISSELLETNEGDEHYSEKLVRLKNLAIYYYRPPAPSLLKSRGHFGLPASGALYVCPQALFKFHPEFDEVLAGILRNDAQGTLVLLHARHEVWAELLRQRFAASLPDVHDRVRFLPSLDHADFLNLNALATILLDPIHFGGGNTSYEGLSLGVPIVTLPSQFLRGRITLALYKQMNLMDCVVSSPQEYIDRAVKLGTNPQYRAEISAKIDAAKGVLFENSAGVRELETFLKQAVAEAKAR